MTWSGFAAVFALFFLTHSVPVQPSVKSRVTKVIGPKGFGFAYSLLSLAMLAALIGASRSAPFIELWPQLLWQRHVTYVGMLAVCLLLALSIGRPNPFSFGGSRNDQYDPTRPGITRWTRHPILLALALWAGAHLFPNGELAQVLLFGVLGIFALAGPGLINKRKQRSLGVADWQRLETARRAAPCFCRPRSWPHFLCRIVVGLGLFVLLLLGHPAIIGVSVV